MRHVPRLLVHVVLAAGQADHFAEMERLCTDIPNWGHSPIATKKKGSTFNQGLNTRDGRRFDVGRGE